MAVVGDILQIRIAEDVYRPLLVVKAGSGSVDGEVLFDPNDGQYPWVSRNLGQAPELFNQISVANRRAYFTGLLIGKDVGEWRYREKGKGR